MKQELKMNTLHVRSLPGNLYERLQKLAESKHRSLSAQVVVMLSDSLEEEELRLKQSEALINIRRRRFTPPAGAPDSLDSIREDRSR